MIARGQQTSASLVKTGDRLAVSFRQSSTGFDRKEPELMKVAGIERAQDGVVALRIRLSITRRYLVKRSATSSLIEARCSASKENLSIVQSSSTDGIVVCSRI